MNFLFAGQKSITLLLTAGDCHIVSMVTEATDECSVLAGEEVKVAGGVAVHIIQENCSIAYTKAVRIKKHASIYVYI